MKLLILSLCLIFIQCYDGYDTCYSHIKNLYPNHKIYQTEESDFLAVKNDTIICIRYSAIEIVSITKLSEYIPRNNND